MGEQNGWAHREAELGGVRLHYVEAGTGPLVLLLHGFPDFWYSWRHQIPALAAAGYRVIAPDLRGYNRSSKPSGLSSYRLGTLVDDVIGLIRHAGERSATVVGHDWGGVIAWRLGMSHPEWVQRLVILNAPHPAAFARELRTSDQMLRSWYVLFFQLPILPEVLLRAADFAVLERGLRLSSVRPDAFTNEDIRRYKESWAQPGALTAALNYYRASMRLSPRKLLGKVRTIDVPTLLIWGERDPALNIRLTRGLERWVPGIRVERIADASHWVMADAPERVNRLIADFLPAY